MNTRILNCLMLLLFFGGSLFGQELSLQEIRDFAVSDESRLRQMIEKKIQTNGRVDVKLYARGMGMDGILIQQLLIPIVLNHQNEVQFSMNYFDASLFDVTDETMSQRNYEEEIRQIKIQNLYPREFTKYLLRSSESLYSDNWKVIAAEIGFDPSRVENFSDKMAVSLHSANAAQSEIQHPGINYAILVIDGVIVDLTLNFFPANLTTLLTGCGNYSRCVEQGMPRLLNQILGNSTQAAACFSCWLGNPLGCWSCLVSTFLLDDYANTVESNCEVDPLHYYPSGSNPDDTPIVYDCGSGNYCAHTEYRDVLTFAEVKSNDCGECININHVQSVGYGRINIEMPDHYMYWNRDIPRPLFVQDYPDIWYDVQIYIDGLATSQIPGDFRHELPIDNYQDVLSTPPYYYDLYSKKLPEGTDISIEVKGRADVLECENAVALFETACPEVNFGIEYQQLVAHFIYPELSPYAVVYKLVNSQGFVLESGSVNESETIEFETVLGLNDEYQLLYHTYHPQFGTDEITGIETCNDDISVVVDLCDLDVFPIAVIPEPAMIGTDYGSVHISGSQTAFDYILLNTLTNQPQHSGTYLANSELELFDLPVGNYCLQISYSLNSTTICTEDICFLIVPDNTQWSGDPCPSEFNLTATIVDALDVNISSGSITINTGIPGNYGTFYWSDLPGFSTSNVRENLLPGTYCVEMYEGACEGSACFEVGILCDINVLYAVESACNNANNGAIFLSPNGGEGPYLYSWSNGTNNSSIFNVTAGEYTVSIWDTNLCLAIETIEVSDIADDLFFIQADHSTNSLEISNSSSTNMIYWSGPGINEENYHDPIHNDLPPGEYCVVVETEWGCTNENCVTLYPPLELNLDNIPICGNTDLFQSCLAITGGSGNYNIDWDSGSSSYCTPALYGTEYCVTVTDLPDQETLTQCYTFEPSNILNLAEELNIFLEASCPNEENGTICAESAGGGNNHDFEWSIGTTIVSYNSCILNDAPPNTEITLIATDECGFQGIATYQLPDYMLPTIGSVDFTPACEGSFNGSISFEPTNGKPGYESFRWVGGTLDGEVITSEPELDNLGAGAYCIFITDACGESYKQHCLILEEYENINPLELSWAIKKDCSNTFGDGAIDVTISGDDPNNYSIEWHNQWFNLPATEDISGLFPGLYELTITQNTGCETFASIEMEAANPQFANPDYIRHPCAGQSNGGVNGYLDPHIPDVTTYSWSHDSSLGQNHGAVGGLSAGNYTVTATSEDGCTLINTWTLEDITTVGTITGTVTDVLGWMDPNAADHFGLTSHLGAIDLSVSGSSTQNYIYLWNNGANTPDISDLDVGFYRVTVTNDNGCTATKLFNVVDQNSECGIEVGMTASDPCNTSVFKNRLTATPNNNNGSAGPFYYTWTKNGNEIHKGEGYETVKTEGPNGDYLVIVTDANGCWGSLEMEHDRTDAGESFVMEADTENMTFEDETFRVYQSCDGKKYCGSFPGDFWIIGGPNPNDGDLKFYPINPNFPCTSGGVILCTASNTVMATVPPIPNADDVSSGSTCACLFPTGSVPDLFEYPVYAKYICPGDEDIDGGTTNGSGFDDCVDTEEEIDDDGCNVQVFCIKADGERIPWYTYDGDNVQACRLETFSGCHTIRSFCACSYESIEDGAADPTTPTTWDELIFNCEDDTNLPTCDELFDACWNIGDDDPEFRDNGNEEIDQPVFAVYPNPYVDAITIRGKNPGKDFIGEVFIANSLGEIVMRKITKFENGGTITRFNGLEHLPEGIYLLVIRDKDTVLKTERLLKLNP